MVGHTAFKYSIWISVQTAINFLYNINTSVFINKLESVYSAVRTGALNKAVCASYLEGLEADTMRTGLGILDKPNTY